MFPMCIFSSALANLFFVSLFCRSSFLCFRPMDIICDNEYWSVMLCCLIPLSRWRASKSERERLLRPRTREAVQEEKTGRYGFQTKQINTGRYRSQTHAYLCQHRCLTATSSWIRARCGKLQWDSRSWLEQSARTYRPSHGPPELQCERVVIEESGDHSAGHRASEGRRDVFRDGEEWDEAARDPARLGCGPVRLDRYTCANSIEESLQM